MAYLDQRVYKKQDVAWLIWIIQQYQLNIPQNQSLCNYGSIVVFTCGTSNGVYGITRIDTSAYISGVYPTTPPSLVTFYFPVLTFCKITGLVQTVSNPSLNILDRLRNLPSVVSIEINEGSCKSIPNDFPFGLSKLEILRIGSPIESAPTFFNNSASIRTMTLVANGSLNIGETINMPSLNYFGLTLMVQSTYSMTMTKRSFPKMSNLIVASTTNSLIRVRVESMPYINLLSPSSNALYDLTVVDPSSVIGLTIYETRSTFSPSSLDVYPNIERIAIVKSNLSQYPWTTFPPKLFGFDFSRSNFSSIPNITLPSTIESVVFTQCGIKGEIPWNIFDNLGTFSLNLNQNPLLTGVVPSTMCKINSLQILNTGITGAPNCFLCYDGDSFHFSKTFPTPAGFICNITIDQYSLSTFGGTANITGDSIGFGGVSNQVYRLEPLVPNSNIAIYLQNPTAFYYGKQVNVSLSSIIPRYTYTFTFTEVGVVWANETILQATNSTSFTLFFHVLSPMLVHSVTINSNIPCLNVTQLSQKITCQTNYSLSTGSYNLTISNVYGSNQKTIFYSQRYPSVSSVSISTNQIDKSYRVLIYGNFGSLGQANPSVSINSTTPCNIESISETLIQCNITSIGNRYGPATLTILVDGAYYTNTNSLFFTPPPIEPSPDFKKQCEQQTHNCNSNGVCNDLGSCQCNIGFNQNDNCLTKYINDTIPIETNQTSPVTKFDIEGVQFMFEMYSIQELGVDGETVVTELFTKDWISSIEKNGELTTANYTLQISDDNITTPQPNVTATISFSSKQRDFTFGNQSFTLAPNTIKVTVGIDNWAFQKYYLKTTINKNEIVGRDCQLETVDSFLYDSLGNTIQYLKVIKDGIQFTGRFIDYVLSDGRQSYSKTQIVTSNSNNNNSTTDESIAFIGINMPQCQSCVIDPDFTPLLVDNKNSLNGCDSESQSNTWKIIVGSCVGGAIFLSLVCALAYYLKKSNHIKLKVAQLSLKLKKLKRNN
ncbi:EGF-like domain-containing protein [Cavenderia fasciculata]|uniref:EGF-like domain-containing protein n=1 Tax=Cavenderia fasciculata TaxID=261658 RepID=F4PXI3_CACFS|nr:EGF-like domain-containing protein [Cavenderia fasciculata]EGG19493.1 EGF-like domain-containing protein [Cavenderia fasciculata]|eukprot:XP_004357787.1 EGF-like domain-containing protein [Cavenderia fasciculata]